MRTIGLIGGISWPSTLEYYRILNQLAAVRLGSDHSAKLILISLDVGEIYALMAKGDEERIYEIVSGAAATLENAGAQILVLCANGVHRFYDRLSAEITLPIVHIVDATATGIVAAGLTKVGLLGVRKTMEGRFYQERLAAAGIEVLIPSAEDRDFVDRSIFEELIRNRFTPEMKQKYLQVIERLKEAGAQGVVLGCTEIPLLIQQADTAVPLFSTTDLHCSASILAAFAD